MRLTAVQRWPELPVAPATAMVAAFAEIRVVEIVQDDQRVVAAEFQRGALVARLGRDHLAHRHAAGEGDDVDVGIGDHRVADSPSASR